MKTNIVVLLISCFLFWPNSGWGGEGEGQATPDLSAIQVLDLPTAQQLALAGNPSMEAAMARVEQARARVQQAAAAWWPSTRSALHPVTDKDMGLVLDCFSDKFDLLESFN